MQAVTEHSVTAFFVAFNLSYVPDAGDAVKGGPQKSGRITLPCLEIPCNRNSLYETRFATSSSRWWCRSGFWIVSFPHGRRLG
jgi:hypothetical protein